MQRRECHLSTPPRRAAPLHLAYQQCMQGDTPPTTPDGLDVRHDEAALQLGGSSRPAWPSRRTTGFCLLTPQFHFSSTPLRLATPRHAKQAFPFPSPYPLGTRCGANQYTSGAPGIEPSKQKKHAVFGAQR